MVKLGMKNYNMILTEKHKKYEHYDKVILINMSFPNYSNT